MWDIMKNTIGVSSAWRTANGAAKQEFMKLKAVDSCEAAGEKWKLYINKN